MMISISPGTVTSVGVGSLALVAVAMQRRSIVLVFSMGPCFCFGGVLLACYGLVVCTHHDVLLVRGEGLFSLNLSLLLRNKWKFLGKFGEPAKCLLFLSTYQYLCPEL